MFGVNSTSSLTDWDEAEPVFKKTKIDEDATSVGTEKQDPRVRTQGGPISILDGDPLRHVFNWLPIEDLGVCNRVCKAWNKYATDLLGPSIKNLYPELKIIDAKEWTRVIGSKNTALSLEDEPSAVNFGVYKALESLVKLRRGEDPRIFLLTIPKGMDLQEIKKIGKFICVIENEILGDVGNKTVAKTYRVVILADVLRETKSLTVKGKESVITEMDGKVHSPPRILEVASLIACMNVLDPEHPVYAPSQYKDDKVPDYTYTLCEEHADNGLRLKVGGNDTEGARILLQPATDTNQLTGVSAAVRIGE